MDLVFWSSEIHPSLMLLVSQQYSYWSVVAEHTDSKRERALVVAHSPQSTAGDACWFEGYFPENDGCMLELGSSMQQSSRSMDI